MKIAAEARAKKARSDFLLSRCRVIKLSLIELEMFGARILTFNSFHLKRFCSAAQRTNIPLFRFDLCGVVVFGKCLLKERKVPSWIKQEQKKIKTASKNKGRMLYLNASRVYWIHAPLFMNAAFHCSSQHCQFLCMCCVSFNTIKRLPAFGPSPCPPLQIDAKTSYLLDLVQAKWRITAYQRHICLSSFDTCK